MTEETPTWTARFVPAPLDATQYDLPSPAALHPLTDIATLTARIDALETQNAMLLDAVQRHADALQVLLLRQDDGK